MRDGGDRVARDAVVRLDMPNNPGAYLQIASGLNNNGRLEIRLGNPTSLAVADIGLLIRFADGRGALQTRRLSLDGTLPAGETQQFSTRLGPFPSEQAYEVVIERARPLSTQR